MKTLLSAFVIISSFQSSVSAQSNPSSALEARANSLYAANEDQKALEAYQQILELHPERYEALWKTSFLYSRIGNRQEEKEDQAEYFNKARALAERALEVDSTGAQSNFVMSVAMGRMALISGARERVAAARAIKKYVDQALAADSTHAGAWHVLGRWHFKLANLNFIERLAANALFGGIPGNATEEKAEQTIERAIELDPQYVLYYYDLARVYDERGKEEQAVQICREALQLESLTPDDPGIKEDCRGLIRGLE